MQAKLDGLGRPVEQAQSGLGAFGVRYSAGDEDTVLRELRKNDVGIGNNPDSYFNMALTPEEKDRIFPQQSGYYIQQIVTDLMQDPEYQAQSTKDKQTQLQYAIEAARKSAAGDIPGRLTDQEQEARAELFRARNEPTPGLP